MNGVSPGLSVAIILLIAVAVSVAAVADHVAAFRRGGDAREKNLRDRLHRLYYRDRAAFEYEIIAKKPIELVRPQLPRLPVEAHRLGITFPPASQASHDAMAALNAAKDIA